MSLGCGLWLLVARAGSVGWSQTNEIVVDQSKLASGGYERIRIEFDSVLNRSYTIQYSADAQSWKTVEPPVLGTGERMRWVDSGPPETESAPGSDKARFYRVLHAQ